MRAASTYLWFVAIIALLAGCATSRASQPATVALQRPVHFTTSDGTVVAPAGTYRVEQSEPSELTLVPLKGGKGLVVAALETSPRQRLDSPVALSIPQESDDVHHVVLLLPGKMALGTAWRRDEDE